MSRMRKTRILGRMRRLICALLGICVPGMMIAGCRGNVPGEQPSASAQKERLKVVSVLKPTKRPLTRTTTQPATVHAFQQAEIYAKVSGYLKTLHVDIGQTVKPQETLAVIAVPELQKSRAALDAAVKRMEAVEARRKAEQSLAGAGHRAAQALRDQADAQVQQAVAQLDADWKERNRVKGLVADMSFEARLLDEAEKKYQSSKAAKTAADASLVSAKAQVDVAAEKVKVAAQMSNAAKEETNVARKKLDETDELLKYATLKAPFAGVLTERRVDPGDLIRNVQTASGEPREPLLVIADLSRVRVHVMVPENDAPLIRVGAKTALKLRSLPGRAFAGTVTRFSHKLDKRTQTMLVEIVLDNPEEDGKRVLLPGMYGEATIALARKPSAMVLPADAVRFDASGKSTVYTLNANDAVQVVPVKTGLDFGDEIEILSGVSETDRIVGATVGRLKPGQKVHVR